jgi:hypothetical protein
MSVDWGVLSDICADLQGARDTLEVTAIWHRSLPSLDGCKLIYSHPDESDTVLPSKGWPRDFPKGGFLRPLFAHDNLFFLDERIALEQYLGVESPLDIDSTVEFDTNVASYVEGFVENRAGHNSEKVKEVLDFVITTERVNFGYNFYALENAQGFYDGSLAPSILRNLRAIMKLDHLDKEAYLAAGEVRATITDEELQVKAEEKLHELYDSHYEEGMKAEFLPVNEMLYLLLLKTVEIEYRVGRGKLGRKVEDLYEFMHFELKTLFVREAIIALNYFKNRSSLTFFGKINPKPKERSPELLKGLRNMSWDLMLFRVMERMATLPGQGHFLIPYFLTFDRKMVQLFDLFPLKAILSHGDTARMIPLWETDPLDELRKAVDIKGVEHYFGEIAGRVRQSERLLDPRPDFSALREELEREVIKLLSH